MGGGDKMPFLKVEGLTKFFGGLRAVGNVAFEVEKGEIIGLIGPNGSGKTTILNLLTGFLKPDSGTITFRDENVTGLPRHRMGQKGMARTFQLTKTFFDFTAMQNVMVGRAYGREPARSLQVAEEESKEILDRVGLLGKATVLAKDLTLMERKRLELARALAAKPQLLLLDELMAGLNYAEAEEAMKLIRQIRDSNITIVVVEHIVKAILGLSDRIIVLNMGEKIAEGSPEEIVCDPQVVEVYLGKARYA
jgi:branched-chain amino acid transport system ATP-binding protein